MNNDSSAVNSETTMVNEEYGCVFFGLYVVLRRNTIGFVPKIVEGIHFNTSCVSRETPVGRQKCANTELHPGSSSQSVDNQWE